MINPSPGWWGGGGGGGGGRRVGLGVLPFVNYVVHKSSPKRYGCHVV